MISKSDHNLVKFLTECDEKVIATTFHMMNSIFSFNSRRFNKYTDADNVFAPSSEERKELALQAVKRLGYFGSDSFAYAGRKLIHTQPGVNYQTMVRDVAVLLNNDSGEPYAMPLGFGRFFKLFNIAHGKTVKIPKIAAVSDYEYLTVEFLMKKFIKGKSTDELVEIFQDCDLSRKQAVKAAVKISKYGVAGTTLMLLVKLLGKKAVKDIVMVIVAQILEKYLGREAAKIIIQKIATKATQKLFAKIVSGAGWILVGIDVIKLAGPATRITIPTVAYLASLRLAAAMEQGV